ncbi:hypothetical protein HK099_000686 [Clydaea vesicula]|uniref:CST complex subunit CTC1 n=1 Tax=Clydaea vesicula TaxID=447962 RepID=A0AAD5Y1J0_9FUNG|nr:hypothetical protein HK099_000686 [Clydaea vesicula]
MSNNDKIYYRQSSLQNLFTTGAYDGTDVQFIGMPYVNKVLVKGTSISNPWDYFLCQIVNKPKALLHVNKLISCQENNYKSMNDSSTLNEEFLPVKMKMNLEKSNINTYLIDRTGVIPCFFYFLELNKVDNDQIFLVSMWNLAKSNNSDTSFLYLEILIQPVLLKFDDFLSCTFSFTSVEFDLKNFLLKKYLFEKREAEKRISVILNAGKKLQTFAKHCNLLGKIVAKSSMIEDGSDGVVIFCLEIMVNEANMSLVDDRVIDANNKVVLIFNLECNDTLSEFSSNFNNLFVGENYFFNNVKVVRCNLPQENIVKYVLLFQPHSTVQPLFTLQFVLPDEMLTSSQSQQAHSHNKLSSVTWNESVQICSQDMNSLPLGFASQSLLSQQEVRNLDALITYTGEITDYNDATMIFDNFIEVKLYHSLTFLPLRIGSKVEIQNVHFLHFNNKFIFGCCPYTSLRILQFSTIPNELRTLKGLAGTNFYQSEVKKFLESQLQKKGVTGNGSVSSFMKKLGFQTTDNSNVNIDDHFISHATKCNLNFDTRCFVPSLPLIKDLVENDRIVEYFKAFDTSLLDIIERVHFKVFSKEDIGMKDCWLIGILQLGMASVILKDGSGSIPVCLVHDEENFTPEQIGSVFGIKNFELFVEFFAEEMSNPAKSPIIKKVYVRFKYTDAICLDKCFKNKEKKKFGVNNNKVLFFVSHVQTPFLRTAEDGVQFLETWVHGYTLITRFELEGQVKRFEFLTKQGIFSCLRLSGSAVFNSAFLKVGNTYLFEGAELFECPNFNTCSSIANYCRKYKEFAFNFLEDTLIKSVFFTNSSNLNYLREMSSKGHFGGIFKSEKDEMIYDQFMMANQREQLTVLRVGKLQEQKNSIDSYLAERLISIEGLVVLKEYRVNDLSHQQDGTEAFKKFWVGSGKPNTKLILRLKEQGKYDNFWFEIYLDLNYLSFPLGIIPGSFVRFRKLSLKQSKSSSLYGNFNLATSVEVLKFHETIQEATSIQFSDENEKNTLISRSLNEHDISLKYRFYLKELYLKKHHDKFLICDQLVIIKAEVKFIKKIEIWMQCKFCLSQTETDGQCPNLCIVKEMPSTEIKCKLNVLVEDGTSEAEFCITNLTDLKTVLQLKNYQAKKFEEIIDSLKIVNRVKVILEPTWVENETGYSVEEDNFFSNEENLNLTAENLNEPEKQESNLRSLFDTQDSFKEFLFLVKIPYFQDNGFSKKSRKDLELSNSPFIFNLAAFNYRKLRQKEHFFNVLNYPKIYCEVLKVEDVNFQAEKIYLMMKIENNRS